MTALDNLSKLLSRLPGVGPKSASRIAFSLINTSRDYNDLLAKSIAEIKDKVRPCSALSSSPRMSFRSRQAEHTTGFSMSWAER